MRSLLLLTLLLLTATIGTSAQTTAEDSLNMTLFDHVNPVDTVGQHTSLWGYTAPDGREYALFGSQIGVYIYDITERPIRQVGYIWGPRNPWRNIKTYKQYAYISCESHDSGSGLQIVDLSDLPRSATLIRTDTSEFVSAHTLYATDHYLFANGTQPEGHANGGTIILDLEPDPTHPRRLGQVDPYYLHDCFVRNDTLIGAAVYGQGCDIWDIKDPAHPVRLANFNYPYSGTHNAEMTPDGNFVGTSDEINFTPKTLKIWDIRDLSNITKIAEFTPNPNDIIHNTHFIGHYAYIAWYTAGVRIVDMIDPYHPREIAYYDTYPGSGGFNGVWEVYAHFSSGKVIASDRNSGLWVLNVDLKDAGSVSGTVRDAKSGKPLANVEIYVPEKKKTITTDNAGRYYVGGVSGDRVTLNLSKFGYGGRTESATMEGDVTLDITLDPLEINSLVIRARDERGEAIEDFFYAVEPYITSTASTNGAGSARLPHDSTFTVTVGKWGYGIVRIPVTIIGDGQEVTANLVPRYEDDATLDLGWSFDDPADKAITGRWVRIIPYLGYINSGWIHPETEPSKEGGYVFMTGAPPKDANPQDNDVNRGATSLTSPPMNLTRFAEPKITYDLWYVYFLKDIVRDSLNVQLSNDDGLNWQTIRFDTASIETSPFRPYWRRDTIEPGRYMALTPRMRFRVVASDTLGNSTVFAAMDNFLVEGTLIPDSLHPHPGPQRAALQITPNPSTGKGKIIVGVPEGDHDVQLEIFNEAGQQVAVFHGILGVGDHDFDIIDPLGAGWYAVKLVVDGQLAQSTSMVVLH